MLIMAFMPYIEIMIAVGIKSLKKLLDSGLFCLQKEDSQMKTKKKSPSQYIILYAGPEYLMHFKYSTLMVQVYVSFMYGLFIPFLFITTCIGIINMYIVERLCMSYYYRKPPIYDAALNMQAIRILKGAPIFMFLFGYWALSNRQIFFNEAYGHVDHANKAHDPGHEAFAKWANLNHTHLMFFALIIYILLLIFGSLFGKLCPCFKGPSLDKDVDENLASYWKTIVGKEQKEWYADEIYKRAVLGIKTLDNRALKHLGTAKRDKKHIHGMYNYEILSNIKYSEAF